MVIATDAGLLCTFSDLRPEGEEQNPNAGQPHEDTSVEKKNGGRKNKKRRKKETQFMSQKTFSVMSISFISLRT